MEDYYRKQKWFVVEAVYCIYSIILLFDTKLCQNTDNVTMVTSSLTADPVFTLNLSLEHCSKNYICVNSFIFHANWYVSIPQQTSRD